MTPSAPDQLPNIFQANLMRLYDRAIKPTMLSLTVHERLESGEASSLDEFLDRAAAQVDNYTANEAAKAYTLIITALFERQLRIWASHIFPPDRTPKVQFQEFKFLATDCACVAGFDIDQLNMAHDLEEAFLVSNVVRHGDGSSSARLQNFAPALWVNNPLEYVDLLSVPSPSSETLRIGVADLQRYLRAGLRYWGHASTTPHAVTDPAI